MHNVFHVSQLKKCLRVSEEQLPLEDMENNEDLTYQEYPVNILEASDRITRNNRYRMLKVQWNHHIEDEVTWEREAKSKEEFPEFFSDPSKPRGRDSP